MELDSDGSGTMREYDEYDGYGTTHNFTWAYNADTGKLIMFLYSTLKEDRRPVEQIQLFRRPSFAFRHYIGYVAMLYGMRYNAI